MRNIGLMLFTTILVEMVVFIVVGKWIGILPTIFIVILSTLSGIYLMKRIGIASSRQIDRSIHLGQAPTANIIQSFVKFVGSVFLIVPGLLTSIIGLLLFLPFMQHLVKPLFFVWMRKKMKNNKFMIYQK